MAHGPAALRVARTATTRIPIVATDFETDPVAAGFAQSLARPGGNVTGAFLDQAELSGKWLELVREVIPRLVRITAIHDASTPADQSRALQMSAKVFRVQSRRSRSVACRTSSERSSPRSGTGLRLFYSCHRRSYPVMDGRSRIVQP